MTESTKNFPRFFIIGAPKCGTTSLSQYLHEHPDVFMCEPKEPNFFNSDLRMRGRVSTMKGYLWLFKDAAGRSAIGEASAWYLYSEKAVPEILRFKPQAKFIVMVREPVSLFRSLYYQETRVANEDVSSAEEAWRLQAVRSKGEMIPLLCDEPQKLQYGKVCSLGWQIARLKELVPPENLKIIFFEDFVRDTRQVYQEVLEFIGVKDDRRSDFPRHNEGTTVRRPWLQKLLALVSIGKGWLGIRRHTNLLRFVANRNLRGISQPESAEFIKELRDYFKADLALLEQATGRELDT